MESDSSHDFKCPSVDREMRNVMNVLSYQTQYFPIIGSADKDIAAYLGAPYCANCADPLRNAALALYDIFCFFRTRIVSRVL